MAQTGYTPISIYYSSTAGNTPTAGNLVAGELAINTADGKLFYKDSAGVVQVIAGKGGAGVAGGSNTQVQYNSSGSLAGSANFTFNGTTVTIANDASISGLTVGKGGGSVNGNTALGFSTLAGTNTGANNTGVGVYALYTNTSGAYNTAIGAGVYGSDYGALGYNTTGSYNTAVGVQASLKNTTGGYNTSVGVLALANNTTASNNTAVGYQASYNGTTGDENVAVGAGAMYSTTTGNAQVAVGRNALNANTTGAENTAIGRTTLLLNTTGNLNSGMGRGVLQNNTTGSYNTGSGAFALFSNTTASRHTAVGYQAGYSVTTNDAVTAVGYLAGNANTGGFSAFFGRNAGYLSTASKGTMIGDGAGSEITSGANNTILGRYNGNQGGLDIRTASNYIVLSDGDGNPYCRLNGASGNKYWVFGTGGTSTADYAGGAIILNGTSGSGIQPIFVAQGNGTTFWQIATQGNLAGSAATNIVIQNGNSGGVYLNGAGATSWSAYSDSRLKDITGTYTNALADIAQIEPVKFTWKDDENKRPCVGVIAQSVLPVVPEAVGQTKRSKDDETEYYSVSYTDLIPLLIASVQELKAEVDSLKQQLGK